MKKSSLIKYIIAGLAVITAAVCVVLLLQNESCGGARGIDEDDPIIYPSIEPTSATQPATTQAAEAQTQEPETEAPTEPEPYVSPINWDELWEKNPEIYAWLYIPDTEISFPVCQREGDDTYYLDHSAYLREYEAGALMTESQYNDKSFEQPVTIIYGHKMRSGAMFGTLQSTYSTQEGFDAHREMIIYLPDRELHYTVWVTTPFDRYHLMKTYDFTDSRHMRLFIKKIKEVRSIEGQKDESLEVTSDDRLLILSTCLMGKVSKRYLVIGRLDAVK